MIRNSINYVVVRRSRYGATDRSVGIFAAKAAPTTNALLVVRRRRVVIRRLRLQRGGDAVDAEDVVHVERRDPVEVLDELKAVVLAAHGRRVIGEP